MAGKPRRHDPLLRGLLEVDLFLAALVGIMFVTVYAIEARVGVGSSGDDIAGDGLVTTPATQVSGAGSDDLDVLLLDTEGDAPGATRSIAVLHVSADRDSASVVSIPRNLWVPIPGLGNRRLETAFALAGPSLGIRTVEELSGLRIDHCAVVDWRATPAVPEVLGSALRRATVAGHWPASERRDLLRDLRILPPGSLHHLGVPVRAVGREHTRRVVYLDRPANRSLWRHVRQDRGLDRVAAHPQGGS